MPHETTLITTVAAALGLALVLGLVASRLRLPPLVGYLLAGIAIGPATPGFVADLGLTRQLAEIGVMLLMFGVGLHLSFADLLAVRRVAIPGALAQIAATAALGLGAARLWGFPIGEALVFGLALTSASTVVLLRTLEARGEVTSLAGRIAIGWLVIQDVAMVLVLVLLPPLSGVLGGVVARDHGGATAGAIWPQLGVTVAKLAAFVALMLVVGRRLFPRLLLGVARTGSRELFTLGVVATAVCVAYGSAALFDVSFALGAFFAGVLMRESELSHRAAAESLPLREAFSVLFFVSVGMLFDPSIVAREPLRVFGVIAIVVCGTPAVVGGLLLTLRQPLETVLAVAAGLAQVGEFALLVAALGARLGILSGEAQSLILTAVLGSIALNPLIVAALEPAHGRLRRWAWLARRSLPQTHDPLAELPPSTDVARLVRHVVLVGHGRVGRRIAEALATEGLDFVVVERDRDLVARLRASGVPALAGDAASPGLLAAARIDTARLLVVATPDVLACRAAVEGARTLNPTIEILLRTQSEEEEALLRAEGLGTVFFGEHELAQSMIHYALATR